MESRSSKYRLTTPPNQPRHPISCIAPRRLSPIGFHDSPLYQLIDGITPLSVRSDKTDVFRDQVAYAEARKAELANARALARTDRKAGQAAVAAVRQSLGRLDAVEAGVAVDLLLSYRAARDWPAMIGLVGDMSEPLRTSVMVQEQLGFALNRAGRGEEAEKVPLDLIERRGPSSETLGILGRVYKDRWEAAAKAGDRLAARALLNKAIDAYRRGFETDWRDHYPGINAVTLMELKEPPDPERLRVHREHPSLLRARPAVGKRAGLSLRLTGAMPFASRLPSRNGRLLAGGCSSGRSRDFASGR